MIFLPYSPQNSTFLKICCINFGIFLPLLFCGPKRGVRVHPRTPLGTALCSLSCNLQWKHNVYNIYIYSLQHLKPKSYSDIYFSLDLNKKITEKNSADKYNRTGGGGESGASVVNTTEGLVLFWVTASLMYLMCSIHRIDSSNACLELLGAGDALF